MNSLTCSRATVEIQMYNGELLHLEFAELESFDVENQFIGLEQIRTEKITLKLFGTLKKL